MMNKTHSMRLCWLLLYIAGDLHRVAAGEPSNARTRVFVNYAFYNNGRDALRNYRFFLQHGVKPSPEFTVEYGVVVKGKCQSDECTNPALFLQHAEYINLLTFINAENVGFDFGSHSSMLEHLASENRQPYDYYIFLNCGVVGPIVPSYMPTSWHWASAFIGKMTHKVGLVGTSIVCLPATDLGGFGPKVEGFAFALSSRALQVALDKGTSFQQHTTKIKAVVQGELALTTTLMNNGIGIDCLLQAYQGIDWFDKDEWKCNHNIYPTREKAYHGLSVDPLEVIFHKVWWFRSAPVNLKQTEKFVQWADESRNRSKLRNQ